MSVKTTSLEEGTVYAGADGERRFVMRIFGRGRNRCVKWRLAADTQPPQHYFTKVKKFADWAQFEVIPS